MTTNTSQNDPGDTIDILLVEDNPGDIRLIKEAFNEADTEIKFQTVTNGDDAVDLLKRQTTDESHSFPDIVLLDLNLPGRDGDEVLKTIRADSQLEALPVMMLTSSEARDDIKRCYQAHTNAYLTKPNSPGEFDAIVTALEEFWFKQVRLPPIAQ